jgi:hypothetical protein
MKIKWSDLGKRFGLKGPDDTVEIADDAPALETVSSSSPSQEAPVATTDPETDRLRSDLAAARRREEERINRDSLSFASLAVRDDRIPPYLGNVLAFEYEAVALADLDRPLEANVRIMVGETPCATRVEAMREHYARMKPLGSGRQQVLDRARIVENGSAGEPSEEDRAREQGRAAAKAFNQGK